MLPTYLLSDHLPPAPLPPTLSLSAKGILYPSKALLAKLGLRMGQFIDLLPPSADCPGWQLDVRPTIGRPIVWHDNTRPRVVGLRGAAAFLAPGTRLTLALVSAVPNSLGCYTLRTSLNNTFA